MRAQRWSDNAEDLINNVIYFVENIEWEEEDKGPIDVKEAVSQLESVKESYNELAKEKESLEAELKSMTKEKESKDDEVSDLEKQVKLQATDIEYYENKIEELELENSNLHSMLAEFSMQSLKLEL